MWSSLELVRASVNSSKVNADWVFRIGALVYGVFDMHCFFSPKTNPELISGCLVPFSALDLPSVFGNSL